MSPARQEPGRNKKETAKKQQETTRSKKAVGRSKKQEGSNVFLLFPIQIFPNLNLSYFKLLPIPISNSLHPAIPNSSYPRLNAQLLAGNPL
ncbi:MAG: hypothetical protein ACRC62_29220 [Microcoleus sp.]